MASPQAAGTLYRGDDMPQIDPHILASTQPMPSSVVLSIQTVREVSPKDDWGKAGTEVVQYPESGAAAWCAVIGGVLVQFCGFGYTLSFGIYQDLYTLHCITNQSSSAIPWIGSINAFLGTSIGLVAGALYDQGYFYYLMIGGVLLHSFTMLMLSLAQPGHYYQIFLPQGIALGIAQGILYVATLAVASHYFHKRRTLAMNLIASGTSLGAVVHPMMLNDLINRSISFSSGVRIGAAFISVLFLVACLLVRTRLEPRTKSVSYLSVGKDILYDIPFCIMCIGLLCFQIGFFYPLLYFQLDSVRHGNPETLSLYSLVLLNIGSLIGRLSAGFIAPHIGLLRVMILSTAACTIFTFGMMGLNRVATAVVLGTMYGYIAGVYITLLSPLMALLTGDFSDIGARMGIGVSVLGLGHLLGGPVSGVLLRSEYKWWQPSLFSGLICLIGGGLLIIVQLALTRQRRSVEEQEP